MRRESIILLAIISLIIIHLNGCSNSVESEKEHYLEFSPIYSSYSLADSFIIHSYVINISHRDLYFWLFGVYTSLHRYQNDNWNDLGPWYPLSRHWEERLALSTNDTLHLYPLMYSNVDTTGIYRIEVLIYEDSTMQELIPLNERVSKSFQIYE